MPLNIARWSADWFDQYLQQADDSERNSDALPSAPAD